MAFVNLPPCADFGIGSALPETIRFFASSCGSIYESEKRRQKRIRENTTLDPVERWQLREERIQAQKRGSKR